jgi:hypothetical protein
MAISSPLLEDVSIDGATGILINITGGPDLTLHEVNEASSLIQQAAHEDANIIFGSVIDPNVTDEVRITVIATGFDPARKSQMIVPDGPAPTPPAPRMGRASAERPAVSSPQITLPYDASSQVTKEYPPPVQPPRRMTTEPGFRPPAQIVSDEPDITVTWDAGEVSAVERALEGMDSGHAPDSELSARFAAGSGPQSTDGAPLVTPTKKAAARPSLKTVLGGELDGDSELDVPTFIRRHSQHS